MDSSNCASLILAISLLIISSLQIAEGQTNARCAEQPGWQAKPLTARAQEAANIFYGTVTGIYQGTSPEEYIVEMDITCVLKGSPTVGRANVTEVGTDCMDSAMRKGFSYIVFVHVLRDGVGRNRYVTHDINVERAANKATKENFEAVRQSGVTNQCNNVRYSPVVEEGVGTGARGDTNTGTGNEPPCTTDACRNGRNGSPALFGSTFFLLIATLYSLASS